MFPEMLYETSVPIVDAYGIAVIILGNRHQKVSSNSE